MSKKAYYLDYFSANTSNSKTMWTGIKQVITLNPKPPNSQTKSLKFQYGKSLIQKPQNLIISLLILALT